MTEDIIARLQTAIADRYTIVRQVGQGGMATVYLADDLRHNRRVAIKVLRAELSQSIGGERFLREIEVAAKLQHPHIVPVYDSGSTDGILYYVMPYVEGESLRDLIQSEGRIPLERAAAIIDEVASGLAYAHAHGVVHRDIKPENIMLSDGHAVVADFGIARAVDASRESQGNLTGAGMALGTPAYMSPEQATADNVDARSDQYALACVFYELVTGQQAFSGSTMHATLSAVLTGDRPRLGAVLDGVPAGVDRATQRALSIDPAARFESVTEFARVVTAESSGTAAAERESQRWKRLAIVLPAVVAVAAVIWIVFLAGPPRTVVSGAESIAVVPFSTSGPGLEGVGEGMVDLLTGSLNGVGDIRTVEPRTSIREWHRKIGDGSGDLNDALEVARRTDAASVLMGSIVSTGGTARLTAQLYGRDGDELSSASVDGPVDSVLKLSNSLALALLRDIWRSRAPLPSANASGIRSSSVDAIRAYLTGESYHRRGEWESAQAEFEDAVRHDSTFALAWYKLANTLGWKGQYQSEIARDAAAKAVAYSDSLSPRLQTLLYAADLFNRADNAAIDSARAYTQRYPEDAEGWYLLGEAQYHGSSFRPRSLADLRRPFDRVLSIDSSLTQAAIHPLELAIMSRDSGLIDRYAEVFRAAGATVELDRVRLAREGLAGSDSAIVALFSDAIGSGVAFATLTARTTNPDFTGDSLIAFTSEVVRLAAGTPVEQNLMVVPALLDYATGRIDSGRVRLRQAGLTGQAASYARLLPALAGYAVPGYLTRLDSNLSSQPVNPYVAIMHAQVLLGLGESVRARQLIAAGLAGTDSTTPREVKGALVALDGITLAVSGDTAQALVLADSGIAMIGSPAGLAPFSATVRLRYALLQLAVPGRHREGLALLRWGFREQPGLMPIRQLYLARTFDAGNEPDSAIAHYSSFLRYWNRPDSAYKPLADEARSAITRLSGEQNGGDTLPGTRQ